MSKSLPERGWEIAEQEATQWMCELREGGREERVAFVKWLKDSPRNVRAFLLLTAAVRTFDGVGPKNAAQVDSLISQALAAAPHSNVVALQGRALPSSQHKRSRALGFGIAAGLTILLLSGAMVWRTLHGTPTYDTAVGEQRTVQLADGSTVHLNTRSRVRVRFSERARDIDLVEGEALFTVAKDASRPFRVHSDTSSIEAVGTEFNVHRDSGNTKVSVIEGVVQVEKPGLDTAMRLIAGEEAQIEANGHVSKAVPQDMAEAVAWRERRLVFRSERLADIAAEFNRYNARQIRIVGDEVKDRRFTGTGTATSPESFVQFLAKDSGLTVDIQTDELVIRGH